jgi:hypothetical protein
MDRAARIHTRVIDAPGDLQTYSKHIVVRRPPTSSRSRACAVTVTHSGVRQLPVALHKSANGYENGLAGAFR